MVEAKIAVRDLTIRYGGVAALRDVSLEVRPNEVFAIIGPAGSGKTSFLKSLNRMDTFVSGMKVTGDVLIDGKNVRTWTAST